MTWQLDWRPPAVPEPGTRVEHFKGKRYTFLRLARAEWNPGSYLAIYEPTDQPTRDPLAWARPIEEFMGKGPAGGSRFERLGPGVLPDVAIERAAVAAYLRKLGADISARRTVDRHGFIDGLLQGIAAEIEEGKHAAG